jgi:hypothetical protein
VSPEALMIERGMIVQDGKSAHAGMVARSAAATRSGPHLAGSALSRRDSSFKLFLRSGRHRGQCITLITAGI